MFLRSFQVWPLGVSMKCITRYWDVTLRNGDELERRAWCGVRRVQRSEESRVCYQHLFSPLGNRDRDRREATGDVLLQNLGWDWGIRLGGEVKTWVKITYLLLWLALGYVFLCEQFQTEETRSNESKVWSLKHDEVHRNLFYVLFGLMQELISMV